MDDREDSRQRSKGLLSHGIDSFRTGRTLGKAIQAVKLARTTGALAGATSAAGPIAAIIGVLVIFVFLFVLTQGPTTGEAANLPTDQSSINLPPGNTPEEIKQNVVSLLRNNPTNVAVYKQAASTTKVPWTVLAGIHYIEGGLGSNQSLVSGRTIGTREPDIPSCSSQYSGPGTPIPLSSGGCGFSTLLDSAIYAGRHIVGKIGKNPSTFEDLVTALSRYNGGGNGNCNDARRTSYLGCPRLFEGEDDPYTLAFYDSRHNNMYLIFCSDLTPCSSPLPFNRPGVMTISKTISDNLN